MDNQSSLNKLCTGLLLLDVEKSVKEPGYEAIDRLTRHRSIMQRQYQYAQDLKRALTEAKLTSKLLSIVETGVSIDEKPFEAEDLIIYYEGIFLDCIHQIKDKVLRLVWWMLQEESTQKKQRLEEVEKIKLSSFSQYKALLEKAEIYKLLEEWNQDSSSGISVVLRKRTQHHHFTSNLQLDSDFQNIKMSKIMLSPVSITQLSEYGKTRMKEIGEEAYTKWRGDVIKKQTETLGKIEENINSIAEQLINFYKIPTDPKAHAEIINKFTEIQKKFDIVNKTSVEKISPDLSELIKLFVSHIKQYFKDHLVSVYLVGSVPRGEYIPGSSDINFIVITDIDMKNPAPTRAEPVLSVSFFSEKEFLSTEAKKYRFICYSDGVLITGKKMIFDRNEFPKPGAFLALLLNEGFIDELEQINNEVKELKKPAAKTLRTYSLKAVKIMLDFQFGVAMTNKPFYTASRQEKVQYLKEMFPTVQRQTLTFENIYLRGIIKQEDFPMVIDTFLGNAKKNYEKLKQIEKDISEEEEKKHAK